MLFTRKLFSFFSLQKLLIALFVTIEYNDNETIEFIKADENLYLLVIFSFIMISILIVVHTSMHSLRRNLQLKHWHILQNVFYLLSIMSEAWIIAFVLAVSKDPTNTKEKEMKHLDGTVFLFTNTLTAIVFCITVFLSSGTEMSRNKPIEEELL